jgi:hypothetical protein
MLKSRFYLRYSISSYIINQKTLERFLLSFFKIIREILVQKMAESGGGRHFSYIQQ